MNVACPAPDHRNHLAHENNVAAQAAMYRLIVENTVDTIIRYNASQERIYVSPSSREMFGYAPAELLGQQASMMIHPEDFKRIDPLFKQVGPALPCLQLSFRVCRKDGIYVWVEGQYRYLPDDGGSVAVLRDVTERKNSEKMLEQAHGALEAANVLLRALAQQDGLTGLTNRRRFDELLDEELRNACRLQLPLSVLLLDVDNFKAYNDRYGHIAGDDCLRSISRTIAGALRHPGDHTARYGGEEFVALLPATGEQATLVVAQRVCRAVAALGLPHLGSPYGIVTISIGVSSLARFANRQNPADLVDAADRALYQAKSDGRNCVRSSSAALREAFAAYPDGVMAPATPAP